MTDESRKLLHSVRTASKRSSLIRTTSFHLHILPTACNYDTFTDIRFTSQLAKNI